MKKIVPIAVVILLIGGGYWWMTQKQNSPVENETTTNSEEVKMADDETTKGKFSLKDLLAKGVAQKCTLTISDEAGTYAGTMYVSGNKFRQELVTKLNDVDKEIKSNTASDGENIYIWNDEMGNKGIKMALSEADKGEYSTKDGNFDMGKLYDFDCSRTVVSEAELNPPANIEFQDFGSQLKELQNMQQQFKGIPTIE